ncbi:hypothetical protein RB597_001960 [Gaeumannomyces tritici]
MPSLRTTAALAALCLALSASATPIAAAPRPATKNLGRWQLLSPIALQPRQEHTVVALNATTLALVGGIVPAPGGGGGNSPSDWVTTDMFQLYNVKTATWSPGPALPYAVNHANTVVISDSLYLLGGLVPNAEGNWVATGATHVLRGISSLAASSSGGGPQWQALAPIPEGAARGSAAVAAHDGRVYLAGGMRQLIPQDTVGTVVTYDVAADAWIAAAAPSMPEGRDHAGSAVVGGTLYVLGGRFQGQDNVRDTVFTLDLSDVAAGWATRPGRMPTARGGVAAAAVGSKIYTFGGEGNPANGTAGVFSETEAYDVRADAWQRLAPMEVPRHGSWAVSMPNGGVYVPGGGIRQGGAAVDTFDVFWPPKC